MKKMFETNIAYHQHIHPEIFEQFLLTSPFVVASKIILQNACTTNSIECSYVPRILSTLFSEQPHYYLRVLDLSGNQITTKEVFQLLIALKNYPKISSIILDSNNVDDSFYSSFRYFIQDSIIFPSLRRISLLSRF